MQAEGLPHLLLFPLLLLELSGLFLLLSDTCLESAEIITGCWCVYEPELLAQTYSLKDIFWLYFLNVHSRYTVYPASTYHRRICAPVHISYTNESAYGINHCILTFLPLSKTTRTPPSWFDVRHVLIAAIYVQTEKKQKQATHSREPQVCLLPPKNYHVIRAHARVDETHCDTKAEHSTESCNTIFSDSRRLISGHMLSYGPLTKTSYTFNVIMCYSLHGIQLSVNQ